MNPSQVIRLKQAVERRSTTMCDGAILDNDGLRDLPGRPGVQFNRHFEFLVQNWARFWAESSTRAVQVYTCLRT